MVTPIDVATQSTVTFVSEYVSTPAVVLEVGCGEGHVALELADRGYKVSGLDADADSVATARTSGAPVVLAEWPAYDSEPVDAIVFTRSLHHIHHLDAAIQRSKELLKPGGRLLVEDFAFHEADAKTIDWFMTVINTPEACDLITPAPDEFITNLLAADDPESAWCRDHDHELHTIGAMADPIAKLFKIEQMIFVPYLYRYLIPVLPETNEAAVFAQRAFESELQAGEAGDIVLVGRRIVALYGQSG